MRPSASRRCARSPTWASSRARAIAGHQARHRLHRLVHQRPHRGSARRGRDARRAGASHDGLRVLVVPGFRAGEGCRRRPRGSTRSSRSAGAEWRNPGCSMCLGMNPDILQPGERCASTSNRNFEGRQGRGGRTHLVSPAMAAAAAVEGRFVDVRRMRGRGGRAHEAVSPRGRRAHPARPIRCRHRPDHPQAIPQAHRADRLRRVPLQRLASRRRREPSDPTSSSTRRSTQPGPSW